MKRLERDFYVRDTLTVAKELLGKYLVRSFEGNSLICRITETEAYNGPTDKACHAYNWLRTDRTEPMYHSGGTVYVYLIYGMYYCMNIVTEPEGKPCAVLLRGLEAVSGREVMSRLRYQREYDELSKYQIKNFLNGPGKLCKGLAITKEQNKMDLFGNEIYLYEEEKEPAPKFTTGKRINIDYAGEDAEKPWRFVLEK